MTTSVLIVDDDAFARATLTTALSHHGYRATSAADPAEAMLACDRERPRVAVLDLHLGDGPTGIDLAKAMRRRDPDLGLVLLTSFTDPRLLRESLGERPVGMLHLVKQSMTDTSLLALAIDIAAGESDATLLPPPEIPLSAAQVDTLRLLAAGLSNAEIARVRVVTPATVEKTIARIAKSLDLPVTADVNQRVALARAYYRMIGKGT